MDEKKQRSEDFLKIQEAFRSNGLVIITKMLDWCNQTPGSKHLVDEFLHSIFFLGEINNPKYEPKDIISDEGVLNELKEKYPRPLECYKSQLPMRSPFSCVLDMIVLKIGGDKIEEIKQSLQDLVNTLEQGFLVSSTICVTICETSNNTCSTYYGVSMSTTGPNAGKIVIASSCCSAWDEYVAGAVMTYYPEKASQPSKVHVKKSYFDGTFKLPVNVTCEAFNIKNKTYLAPCRSCGNLFGLDTKEKQEWPYGHCAEVESVSNLLKNEEGVKGEAKPTSPTYTAENRERAKESVLNVLKQVLKMVNFKWNGEFYNPQT